MKRSTKTTAAGLGAGLPLVLGAFAEGIPFRVSLLMVIAGLALCALGVFARDDDVTSEGSLAPKANPPPIVPAPPEEPHP